jgi:hypothetical protein
MTDWDPWYCQLCECESTTVTETGHVFCEDHLDMYRDAQHREAMKGIRSGINDMEHKLWMMRPDGQRIRDDLIDLLHELEV